MASAKIYPARTVSGNQPAVRRLNEKLTQTFLEGVPVQYDAAAGGIMEWDGVTLAGGIAGVSNEAASNLAATGTAQTLTFGSVPYEASAVNIPRGAPLNDGQVGFFSSIGDTIFHGQFANAVAGASTDIGVSYGLTKDADNHWYVDKNKVGADACVVVVGIDENDTRGVYFRFLAASQQQIA